MLVSESSEGGYSVEFPCGTAVTEGRKEESSSRRGKERQTDRQGERERGKVWTMTQGHEPHGDGGGREELLIRACGISYGYHRTDSVLPPMAAAQPPSSRHRSLRQQLNASQPRCYQLRTERRWGIRRGEPGVKFSQVFKKKILSSKPDAVEFGHLGASQGTN